MSESTLVKMSNCWISCRGSYIIATFYVGKALEVHNYDSFLYYLSKDKYRNFSFFLNKTEPIKLGISDKLDMVFSQPSIKT